MTKRPCINKWFLWTFIIWLIMGSLVLLLYSPSEIFRFFNAAHSYPMDILMPFITALGEGWVVSVILVIILIVYQWRNRIHYLLLGVSSIVLTSIATHTLKRIFNYPRPMTLLKEELWFHHLPDWPALFHNSFPSAHTSSAFAMLTLLSFYLNKNYRLYGVHLCILGCLVAWSRMYLAAHFFVDVFVGSIIGTCIPIICMYVLRNFNYKNLLPNEV